MRTDDFPTDVVSSTETVPIHLSQVDTNRAIVHAAALAIDRVLRKQDADAHGLIVTVHGVEDSRGLQSHVVTATAPTHRVPVPAV
jgi:hypothetical protein